ncbi:Mps3 protein [Saccharomycopsis crataegensis]|uniref:Mps3 protein n=1 Tax=Saccharomycopsis crataegensis TaxID=43959 RepID=A0AAV5QHK6_9ASCO|nr:Mps3 protein [Saccharomycopsis crataegensis]
MAKSLANSIKKNNLSKDDISHIFSRIISNDDLIANDDELEEQDEIPPQDFDIDMLNQQFTLMRDWITNGNTQKTTEYIQSDSDMEDQLSQPEEEQEEQEEEQENGQYHNSEQRKPNSRQTSKASHVNIDSPRGTARRQDISESSSVKITNHKGFYMSSLLLFFLCLGYLGLQKLDGSSLLNDYELPENLPTDLKKYVSSKLSNINKDMEGIKGAVQIETAAVNSKLGGINDLIQNYHSENAKAIKEIETKFDTKFGVLHQEVFPQYNEKINSLENEMEKLQQNLNRTLSNFIQQVDNSSNKQIDFERYLEEKLPNYLPIMKGSKNKLTIVPEFESYLHKIISDYVHNNTANYNNSDISSPTFSRQNFNNYLQEFIENADNINIIDLKNSSIGSFIKKQILENINYDLIASKVDKTLQITKDESSRLIIDSTTELILSKLIKRIIINLDREKHNKKIQKFNYASYENGARIIPELVASFESFNITDIFLRQVSHQRKIWSRLKSVFSKKQSTGGIKHNDKNLILNTYQTILPSTIIPKDNFPNFKGIKTGIKTFAVKFPQPIYLNDIIVSYPRYANNPSLIYSAPKKISMWIQLTKPKEDLNKLKNYLYEATKDKYEDQYVINMEKLEQRIEEDKNEIPLKRIKSGEEVIYEKFYESNFNLFDQGFVKIGSMIYNYEPSRDNQTSIHQNFPLINKNFKNLKIRINSVFFSIESNYGNDEFNTNLFKVKVYGFSDFDLYCMRELLFSDETKPKNFTDYKDDLIELENMFNEKYIRNLSYEENDNDGDQLVLSTIPSSGQQGEYKKKELDEDMDFVADSYVIQEDNVVDYF